MALMYCSACGKQISSEAASCPHCGHPNGTRPQSGGGSVIVWVLGVPAVLMLVAAAALAATKPSEAELRAAAFAKRDSYITTEFKDGKQILHVVDPRGNSFIWIFPGGPDAWQYRDCYLWSELVLKFKDGKEILVARGRAGKIWVTDE